MADGDYAASVGEVFALLKRCTKCGEHKPIGGFSKKYAPYGDGYRSECKACVAARNRAWYARSPDAREKAKARSKRNRCVEKWRAKRKAAGLRGRSLDQLIRESAIRAAKQGREYWPRGLLEPGWQRLRYGWPYRPTPKTNAHTVVRRWSKPWCDPSLTKAEQWRLRYRLDPEFRSREYMKALQRKRKRRALMAQGSVDQVRVELFRIQAGSCAYCGRPLPEITDRAVEHVQPISRGGRHEWDNLAIICHPCNGAKWSKPPTREQLIAASKQRARHHGMQRVLL